eukprot:TRINITY_DN7833_c0_g1_i1.p1 TRINITY_DN7833_c0_g1~~TRINITY_DN7833_c0_g1_i1.p1  ORF type:complete len:209 (-),score=49.70 TRINITY_DN7833_c0_g1_i1:273-899(-)
MEQSRSVESDTPVLNLPSQVLQLVATSLAPMTNSQIALGLRLKDTDETNLREVLASLCKENKLRSKRFSFDELYWHDDNIGAHKIIKKKDLPVEEVPLASASQPESPAKKPSTPVSIGKRKAAPRINKVTPFKSPVRNSSSTETTATTPLKRQKVSTNKVAVAPEDMSITQLEEEVERIGHDIEQKKEELAKLKETQANVRFDDFVRF